MTWLLTIAVSGGYQKVLRNFSEICSVIRSKAPTSEKVVIAFKPSIQSQLSNSNVGGWSKVCNQLYASLGSKYDVTVQFVRNHQLKESECLDLEKANQDQDTNEKTEHTSLSTDRLYDHVCMGGTFDRLHTGHKILLSTALIRTKESLTVGVTGQNLLGKKTLTELIEPLDDRIQGVTDFLTDVNRDVELKISEIQDPFGPAIVDPQLECIVGSQETEKGCTAINEKRKEKGLSQLDIHCIELVEDVERRGPHEEEKISSSSMRSRILGQRLLKARKSWDKSEGPYIIGLTGGSASGKSSLGKRFQKLGAGLVDCDKLGHLAYQPGSPTLDKLVKEFGDSVLSEDGTVNRRALGAIVFSDKSQLTKLNQIVWPEISRMAGEQATELYQSGHKVVLLDAAVLIEADWHLNCHEVWVCIVPRETAIERIVERDNKSKEEAQKRIDSQMSNRDRCKIANSVFCTLWDPEITQKQAESAWTRLTKELQL
eukprot:TRINITY_DN4696_c0_g1_i2.p1 TRINITY_DN4696_c0_g1~~TRINITY_DN4696_c0_g1_i2.p1  ORF type:complete len:485 (-),score=66.35 TRINITY_DN4696_c0_g1_i2:180-1634(-)